MLGSFPILVTAGGVPVLELTLHPDALPLRLALRVDDPAEAVLHAVLPGAAILGAVCVRVGTLAVLLVVEIVAIITATVLPHVDAMAAHPAVLELALELAAVSPLEAPVAAHLVLAPQARVPRAIGPEVAPFALLGALDELSVVEATICPDFDALPVYLLRF